MGATGRIDSLLICGGGRMAWVAHVVELLKRKNEYHVSQCDISAERADPDKSVCADHLATISPTEKVRL